MHDELGLDWCVEKARPNAIFLSLQSWHGKSQFVLCIQVKAVLKLNTVWQSHWQPLVSKTTSSSTSATFKWRAGPLQMRHDKRGYGVQENMLFPSDTAWWWSDTTGPPLKIWVCWQQFSSRSAVTQASSIDLQRCSASCQQNVGWQWGGCAFTNHSCLPRGAFHTVSLNHKLTRYSCFSR